MLVNSVPLSETIVFETSCVSGTQQCDRLPSKVANEKRMEMKKIGLIGGLSWVSTAAYYKLLNEMMEAKLGGVSSARLVLESVNRQAFVEAVIGRQDEAAACEQILDAVRGLERAGADFVVISCNGVHRFVPAISREVGIPFLHIAEVTAEAIRLVGINQVALLGVRKTMEGDFYHEILEKNHIRTLIPNDEGRTYIHDKIYEELTKNVFTHETREGYLEVVKELQARGAEGVILGCTEIPLLLSPDQIPMPSFSTTELHCAAAVKMAISE